MIKYISIYAAGLLMLLHTLVPHEHHEDLSYEQNQFKHNTAVSLLDYLELAFHVDMGEGHLEHLDNANGLEFHSLSHLIVINPIAILIHEILPQEGNQNTEAHDYLLDKTLYYDNSFLRETDTRGPPQNS